MYRVLCETLAPRIERSHRERSHRELGRQQSCAVNEKIKFQTTFGYLPAPWWTSLYQLLHVPHPTVNSLMLTTRSRRLEEESQRSFPHVCI
jgi:hypothetical protein